MDNKLSLFFYLLIIFLSDSALAAEKKIYTSELLPPLNAWHGKSESLIQNNDNPWQTPAEKMSLLDTPNYAETISYLKRLVESDRRLQMISLGKSPQGRDIWMVIASKEGHSSADKLKQNGKPTLLAQAGIHSGEIDGKDAGLMLLRDIIHGIKGQLLDKTNLLFVPILSVDAHERRSRYNRVNQRGPTQMGWRTNSQNLNLNRDYAKLDTVELQHLIRAINIWKPDLYFDIHVTDGEDYQYDITYGFTGEHGDSPNISRWLNKHLKPAADKALSENGHLGGPLTFGVNKMDFSEGIVGWTASPRFSNGYGDLRHLPTVLLENHSLKPYKQRVLGTYVMLEATLKLLANNGKQLILATSKDRARRNQQQVVSWETDKANPDSMDFAGIEYTQKTDTNTGLEYIHWFGKPKLFKDLNIYQMRIPKVIVKVPKSYWIPVQYSTVIERLRMHGIEIKIHPDSIKVSGIQLVVKDFALKDTTFEGHQMVNANFNQISASFLLPANSVEIKTDQPLGNLAVALLDPRAPDSFFSWGFFNQIFQRTEYIESYAVIPLAKKLFNETPALKKEFEIKKKTDKQFSVDPNAQMQWIYSHSEFYDQEYLKYPVIIEP